MNESFGAGFNTGAGQGGGSGVQEQNKAEGIVPVTVIQLKRSSEDGLRMYGMSFGAVTLIGIVRNIDYSTTKISYTLEDHTGTIEAHLWLEEDASFKAPTMLLGCYARVYGSLRNQGGTKTLMVFKMTPVTVVNEFTTHNLEVLNAICKARDYCKKGVGTSGGGASGGVIQSGFASQITSVNSLGLTGKHLAIYTAIKGCTANEGISRQELGRKFAHVTSSDLDNIIDFMAQEGHIYTSIDADHFLCTDA